MGKQFVGLFVAYDKQSEDITYISREMSAEELPLNSTQEINKMVTACNEDKPDHIVYLDMYGIVYEGLTELWELTEDIQPALINPNLNSIINQHHYTL